jgi:hypothetical protein
MPFTSIPSRSAWRFAVVLVGVTLLAACEADRPLAPRGDAVPQSPQLAKGTKSGGTIIITVVDLNGATIARTGSTFAGTKSQYAKFGVDDNGWGDEDPALGVIQMSGLQNGQYDVCQLYVPSGYLFPTPACQNVGIGGGGPAKVTFVDAGVPRARWSARDGLSADSIFGALFTIDEGAGPVFIVDNQALDLDKRPGMFEVKLAANGASVKVCPSLPPVGRVYGKTSKACVTKTSNQTTDFGVWYVYPEYSIYWWATVNGAEGYGGTYTVTAVGGGFSMTITNNDASDMWNNSWLYVAVPGIGFYEVCQTVAPTGATLAVPRSAGRGRGVGSAGLPAGVREPVALIAGLTRAADRVAMRVARPDQPCDSLHPPHAHVVDCIGSRG